MGGVRVERVKQLLPRWWGPPGFRGLNVFRWYGGLGLEARAGLLLFIPIGNNDDRTHRGTAMADGLRKRSAGAAAEMFLDPGHWNRCGTVHIAARMPSRIIFSGPKIAS